MKTAFITGATSGIGAATARRLVDGGWQVVALGRRAGRLGVLAAERPGRIHTVMCDVTDRAGLAAAITGLPDAFSNVDLLVNNAGLALGTAAAADASLDDWDRMIATNVTALVSLTRLLLPILIARRGAIVNLSSVAASYPYRGGNVYGGTKAFVRQFSLGLRADLHGTGVRVTSIEPGMVETEFTTVRTGGDRSASDVLYADMTPMSADDIADTIAWIANLPSHLNVNALELMPVDQSFAGFQVDRPGRG